MMEQRHITFQHTTPYGVLNELTENTRRIWLVFHGYGQLSRYFLRKFEGLNPEELEVTSNITFEEGTLKKSHLVLKAKVAGVSEEKFAELVKDAEENCPISKALNMEISVEYTLNA